jgi:hypothetical protein
MEALPLAGLVEAMTLPSSYPDGMLLSSFALAIMLWIMGVCLVEKNWVKSYCSTFRCYLVKFVQPWIN